ncbi:aminotransferase class V-fold PLP-dependent enzyme [Mameliella sediminis]|uniref:aminotransferase class V-fold PLP-dependent enzyme n=1 Tax=Mameliella sediminis TaxID=2836866 RepID=UPI001C4674B7|nr:aminotransferase class V-fold PLP-dependent enzyme [Mameliella sediminis]MBV7396622.1 aminotransferase class V-fold PLP-dependent enzyme [Mameliella sediminis]
MFDDALLTQIRGRFAHVEDCPFTGKRVFFENAGGALTLNSVVEVSARFAAIPDNQGRDNPASKALVEVIAKAREDLRAFVGAEGGAVIVGESGTELLFRLIRDACLGAGAGQALGSTVEHPASRSAMARWAEVSGRKHVLIPHDDATGQVTPEAYAAHVTPDMAVATILHTSPVTGMGMDLAGIAAAIRAVAPECFIIVDGIQHACHGHIDVAGAGVDGYVISPYKVFSRHGYGLAWASDRLTALAHDALIGGPAGNWELGTRDTGAYATFSEVVEYFDWLGGQLSDAGTRVGRLAAARDAIHAQEAGLCKAMIHGTGNLAGLTDLPGVQIVGGADNPAREGLVSFWAEGRDSAEIVAGLNAQGIRTHTRKADHYSGNVLQPLGQADCVRVSLAHYNSMDEVRAFLTAMRSILG